jgi:long-chain fatty acid transport protein
MTGLRRTALLAGASVALLAGASGAAQAGAFAEGATRVALKSEFQPGFIVTTAGFQNIDDRPPEPAGGLSSMFWNPAVVTMKPGWNSDFNATLVAPSARIPGWR